MSNIVNYNFFLLQKRGLGLNLSQIFVTSFLNSSYNTKTKIGAAQRSRSDKQRPIWQSTNFYQKFSNKLLRLAKLMRLDWTQECLLNIFGKFLEPLNLTRYKHGGSLVSHLIGI